MCTEPPPPNPVSVHDLLLLQPIALSHSAGQQQQRLRSVPGAGCSSRAAQRRRLWPGVRALCQPAPSKRGAPPAKEPFPPRGSDTSPTWVSHAPVNGSQVLPLPLLHLLLHLVDLGRVERPQAAFARGAAHLVLHLLETLVQRQVVAHRVLPAVGGCLKEAGGR